MMAYIIGVTHIFAYKVRKYNHFSILQGKGCRQPHLPPPPPPPPPPSSLGIPPLVRILDHMLNAWNRPIDNEHIISVLKEGMITIA